MGIFGHMTANSPIKSGGDGSDGAGKKDSKTPSDAGDHTPKGDVLSFVEGLKAETKTAETKSATAVDKKAVSKDPHFTIDKSPTKNVHFVTKLD